MGEEPRLRYYKPPTLHTKVSEGVWEIDTNLFFEIEQIVHDGSYTKGELVQDFCGKIRERTGYEHAIATGSGTAAIMLLARWYWKNGFRKIRAPAFTWPSTYKPFEWLGYRVRFTDIDPDTWWASFEESPANDELLCPVDTFGNACPIDSLWVDSAQSLGARWEDKDANRVVSLSGSKLITTGEGGMLLTQDAEIANFAENCSWLSRMPEMSSALGLAYLDKLDEILAKKQAIADAYKRRFQNVKWQSIPYSTNNYIVAGLVDSPREWQKANPNVEFRFYYDSIVNEEDEPAPYESYFGKWDPIPWGETGTIFRPHLKHTEYVSRHIIAFPSWGDIPIDAITEMKEP